MTQKFEDANVRFSSKRTSLNRCPDVPYYIDIRYQQFACNAYDEDKTVPKMKQCKEYGIQLVTATNEYGGPTALSQLLLAPFVLLGFTRDIAHEVRTDQSQEHVPAAPLSERVKRAL